MFLNVEEKMMRDLISILLYNTKFSSNGRILGDKIEEDADITITWNMGSIVLGGGETTIRLDTLSGEKGNIWTSDVYVSEPGQRVNQIEFKVKMSTILAAFKSAYLKAMPLKRKMDDTEKVWYKYSIGQNGSFDLEAVSVGGKTVEKGANIDDQPSTDQGQ